ncbi:MAG TPA: carbon-nitrogen hydrolase family protein [Dehalococcoidia bacterium]|nr:carbon-nitrogen hydrolase family protein [Dehalococcoidia bacterium]
MGDALPVYVAAAVQAAPVFMDRDATVAKACELIGEAAHAGAKLIVFPETWIPTYPWWTSSPQLFSSQHFADLWKSSVEVPSDATRRIGEAARAAGAYVVIGVNERDTATRGTLYNTLLYVAPDGTLAHRHRKLMPSFTERTIWGRGDGSDLQVIDTPLGRMGGLICWEHEMTLAKYALYAQGEQVHCAAWPAYSFQNDEIDFGMRQYAYEGACFAVSACGIYSGATLPESFGGVPVTANGGTAIVDPAGRYLAGPVYDREEILYAEINLESALRRKHTRDVAGHYARPDVFEFRVKTAPAPRTNAPSANGGWAHDSASLGDLSIEAADRIAPADAASMQS